MSSTIDPSIPRLTPDLIPQPKLKDGSESAELLATIKSLGLMKHIEGGYFAEIDRNPLIIPNPFRQPSSDIPTPPSENEAGRTALVPRGGDDSIRNASTSIYYMLTPQSPMGCFHRNKGRTVHTLIKGTGRYVLIHADEEGERKRVETFVVGKNVEKGERAVWVVEGGKYKASFLLDEGDAEGLLISEVRILSPIYDSRKRMWEWVSGDVAWMRLMTG